MIMLYSGTPGSGKSLHTAKLIYWRLKKAQPIIANFEIDTSKVKNCKGEFIHVDTFDLSAEYLIKFANQYWQGRKPEENEILVIIDEAQLIFNSRDWNTKGRREWLNFFTLHRHLGFKVVLASQQDTMLDKQIRGVIEFEVKHIKLSNYGWKGWLLSIWFLGKLFQAKQYNYSGKTRIDCQYFLASKKYYSLYDTFKIFDGADCAVSAASAGDGATKESNETQSK